MYYCGLFGCVEPMKEQYWGIMLLGQVAFPCVFVDGLGSFL